MTQPAVAVNRSVVRVVVAVLCVVGLVIVAVGVFAGWGGATRVKDWVGAGFLIAALLGLDLLL